MTPQERQMLGDLFERISSTNSGPRDPQAEAFINDAVRAMPYAPYMLAQTVLVQQHALEAATQRIKELEAQTNPAPAPQETSFLGGLGRTLFGGGSPPSPPRAPNSYDASAYQRGATAPPPPQFAPPPQYAPPPQAGPWSAPSSGGFLSSALHTAAGVAGGVVIANAVENLLGGHGGGTVWRARVRGKRTWRAAGNRETTTITTTRPMGGRQADDALHGPGSGQYCRCGRRQRRRLGQQLGFMRKA